MNIAFDHDRIFAGICFHVLQPQMLHWQEYDQLTPDSLLRLYDRMEAEGTTAEVSRYDWRVWTDQQRFTWLLKAIRPATDC